jgi:hypothetical protein
VLATGRAAVQASVDPGYQYCDTLDSRLKGWGFDVRRNVAANPYTLGLVAQKEKVVTIGLVGYVIGFIGAMSMDNPDPTTVSQFSDRIADLAKESGATGHFVWTMTIPIIVTNVIDSNVRTWVTESKVISRGNMLVRPVIAVHSSREIVFSQKADFNTTLTGIFFNPTIKEFPSLYLQW